MTLEELHKCIHRGPGIVIGPGVTTNQSRELELLRQLQTSFSVEENITEFRTYLNYSDAIFAKHQATSDEILAKITSFFKETTPRNPILQDVVKGNWTAVISLTSDEHFKEELRQHLRKKPIRWTVDTISSPSDPVSQTTTPYYAMLGDINDAREGHGLTWRQSDYLKRVRSWPSMLKTLPDVLKGDPLIFLGTDSIPERTCDFVNALLSLEPKIPHRLIFLSSDPTANSSTLTNLVRGLSQIETVDCSLTHIGDSLSRETLSISKLPLFSQNTSQSVDPSILFSIEDQVAYVPKKSEISHNKEERNRLLDSLFRPSRLDWSPYACEMEFRRDICGSISAKIRSSFIEITDESPRVFRYVGEAGIGKTVALRSVAFSLAQEDYLCLWIRRFYGEISGSSFRNIIDHLNKIKDKTIKIVFFLDDPLGNRIRPKEVVDSLQALTLNWALVVCTRKTDLGYDNIREDSIPSDQVEISSEFSAEEIERFPQYLVDLRVAEDINRAKDMMPAAGLKQSRDVLCSLWYLLPQTKASIEESLIGEYNRLGEADRVIEAFATAASSGWKSVAKIAYELVTTSSGLDNLPLPVEVLVSGLNISYEKWTESCNVTKPLWGLLYDEDCPSSQTYAYRTRNSVVTDILLGVLNKGSTGHTGEFRCLKTLMQACTSTSAPYRTFLKDVLVDRRKILQSRFSYEQVMELYDVALSAYPRPIPVIEHHKCIARRNLGGDASEIYDDLRKLIALSHNHNILDQDSTANLHTTAAATLSQQIKTGQIDPSEGANRAFEHVSDALQDDQFSMHAHHVHADLLINIASTLRSKDKFAYITNLERAARIINRALLLVPLKGPASHEQSESLGMFRKLRDDILIAYNDSETLPSEAINYFKSSGEQGPMVYVARMLLTSATNTNKGQHFKRVDEFLRDAFKAIGEKGREASDELTLVRVELIINWQLLSSKGPVYWEQFVSDITKLQQNPRYTNDSLLTFYYAISEYHLKNYPQAEAAFQRLRMDHGRNDTRREIRCYFLGDSSSARQLEGTLTTSTGEKRFVFCPEIANDILAKNGHLKRRADEKQHFYIGFTMQGPLAVDSAPPANR